jgi:hypothetical protein
MSFSPSSPVTGAAVTGLTSPTYTLTAATASAANVKQYYVSALGGTQTGVTTHSVGSPFAIAMSVPLVTQVASFFSSLTGFKGKNPLNRYVIKVVKGCTPATGAPPQIMTMRMEIDVPAGAENIDAVNVAAALSLIGGVEFANMAGIFATVQTATL